MAIVAVKDFRREEKDPLDDMLNKISKGLQIAQSIYGIKTAMEQSDLRDLQIQAQEEKNRAETLRNKLSESGLLTPQQVMDSDIVPFKTRNDLAKAVGANDWESAVKKYPALAGNVYEINIATPKRRVTTETGDIIGVDEDSRLLTKAPDIVRPKDLKDFDVNVYKAAIKRGVLETIQKGETGGARTLQEFTEKWMPVDDPEVLRSIPSEIAALKEPVQVIQNGNVITRMGIRRSAVKPIQPTTPLDIVRLQSAQLGITRGQLDIAEQKLKLSEQVEKIKQENERKLRLGKGVYTPDEFYEKFIIVDDREKFAKRSPTTAKYLPDNAIQEVKIQDINGEIDTALGIDKRIFDMATTQAKANKQKETEATSAAWNKADAKMAQEYSEYVSEGRETKNFDEIRKLEEALKAAEQKLGDSFIDRAQGMLPEGVRDIIDPEDRAIEDRVKGQAIKTLKQLLGGQFTEKEGNRILDNTYNPRQKKSENIRRMKELIRTLYDVARSQKAAMDYFSKNGTIKGYEAPKIDINVRNVRQKLPPTKSSEQSQETDDEFLKRYLGR